MNIDGPISHPLVVSETEVAKLDYRLISRFSDKSMSDETRRAYRRVWHEFFTFLDQRHPSNGTAEEVLRWRDNLRRRRKKAATISFNLAYDFVNILNIMWK